MIQIVNVSHEQEDPISRSGLIPKTRGHAPTGRMARENANKLYAVGMAGWLVPTDALI